MSGKSGQPSAPAYQNNTVSNGLGDSATNNNVTLSNYNLGQAQWGQNASQYAQNKLLDENGAETGATDYANNIKAQGLRRFGRDVSDTAGQISAQNARRFGSNSNSDYDSAMKTFGQSTADTLADLNNQYDANKLSYMNDYQNYNTNLLNAGQNALTGVYNVGNSLTGNALNSNNALNNFNNTQYGTQASMWNTQKQADAAVKAAMWQAAGSTLGGIKR